MLPNCRDENVYCFYVLLIVSRSYHGNSDVTMMMMMLMMMHRPTRIQLTIARASAWDAANASVSSSADISVVIVTFAVESHSAMDTGIQQQHHPLPLIIYTCRYAWQRSMKPMGNKLEWKPKWIVVYRYFNMHFSLRLRRRLHKNVNDIHYHLKAAVVTICIYSTPKNGCDRIIVSADANLREAHYAGTPIGP